MFVGLPMMMMMMMKLIQLIGVARVLCQSAYWLFSHSLAHTNTDALEYLGLF